MELSNTVLITCTTFNFPGELAKTLPCILAVLAHRSDVQVVMIDNLSKDAQVHQLLDAVNHPRLRVVKRDLNEGKAISVNKWLKQHVSHINCPRILISMDPDVVFSVDSFDCLVDALDSVPRLGMLGMRFVDNACNPERSLWWPAKTVRVPNKEFRIKCPVFANVAGPLFGIQGYVLSHYLNFKLFPKSKNEELIQKGYIKRAGSDDAFLYDFLKKRGLMQGYLEGTQVEHLKAPPQTENYIR